MEEEYNRIMDLIDKDCIIKHTQNGVYEDPPKRRLHDVLKIQGEYIENLERRLRIVEKAMEKGDASTPRN